MRVRLGAFVVVVSAFSVAPAFSQAPPPGENGRPLITAVDSNSQVTVAPAADLVVVDRNVGIGTATPTVKLDVTGQVNASGGICIASDCRISWAATGNPWNLTGSNISFGTGNVGLGTTTPAFKIDVQGGQVNASGGLCMAGDCRTSWSQIGSPWAVSGSNLTYSGGNIGVGTTSPGARLHVSGGSVLVDNNGTLQWKKADGAAYSAMTLDGADRLSVQSPSRLFITSGGGSTVDIAQAGGSSIQVGARIDMLSGGAGMSVSGGNVGIGTTSPGARLELAAGTNAATAEDIDYIKLVTNDGGLDVGDRWGIRWFQTTSFDMGGIDMVWDGSSLDFVFDGYSGGAQTNLFRIKGTGRVGIGTASPIEKLHVAGNVRVDGNISALYQDVAEWVESAEEILPATVVVADPDRNNQVRSSAGGYDTAVAGVISAQPGVLLGEAGGGKVAVAQSGRVRVKVDASYGAIQRGDLLVTSPTPGHAMRSEAVMLGDTPIHRPGTILGKALEPLAAGTGEILVLLTLQ